MSGLGHLYGPNDDLERNFWTFLVFCEQHLLVCVARWRRHADCDSGDGYHAWENRSHSNSQLGWRGNACAG